MIDPATINLSTLPWLTLEEKTAFPKRPAICFAIDSLGNVQYIGRAKNVKSRWGSDHK
jgi:excinuclease UvrABC nuclease subunit